MFVRKKRNRSGSVSIQIIDKSYGTYRVLKTIGSSNKANEIDRLYRSAMEEIPRMFDQLTLCFGEEDKGQEISVYSIYRYMDKLGSKYKELIEKISFNHTRRVLGNKISIVFYDMTTIYFESSEEDEMRVRGFSKDGKHHLPQIYLGLLVGVKGYPIGYDIFEGNTFEGHTLIPVLEHFQEKFKLSKPVVIADAGLLSKENIAGLKDKGYQYIPGGKPKNEAEQLRLKITDRVWKDEQTGEFSREDDSRLIVSYSFNRAKKDQANRERGLKRLEKQLRSRKLTKGQINNRGYNKYLKFSGDVDISIDYDKYHADGKWDGLKGYITNTGLPHRDVINNYNQLWPIEKAFRISKTDLKVRPVYHRLPDRIATHICISFVAYTIYKEDVGGNCGNA